MTCITVPNRYIASLALLLGYGVSVALGCLAMDKGWGGWFLVAFLSSFSFFYFTGKRLLAEAKMREELKNG